MGGATAISSICDGGNPLTWLIVHLNDFGPMIGAVIGVVFAVVLAIFNRGRISKEAKALEAETAKTE